MKKSIKKFLIIFVLGAITFGFAGNNMVLAITTPAKTAPVKKAVSRPYPYERIFYYKEGESARKSLFDHPNQIDVLSPQSHSVSADGTLSGNIDPEVLVFVKEHNIKLMPHLVNEYFNADTVTQFLNNPSVQQKTLDAMVSEAKLMGYWGWQIDFEQINISNKDAFSVFVARFGAKMKENGLISSVAVIAQTGEDPSKYKKSLWENVIGVYDYKSLSGSVDFLSIMSYDDPDSKGPIARLWWLNKVLKYTLSVVPPEKVSLGLGLYYWKWTTDTGKRIEIGGNKGIQTVLKKYKTTQIYSKEQQAPYIKFKTKDGSYNLWFENGQSVKYKLGLVEKYKLRGFSAWALGLEVPSVWTVIRKDRN